MAGVSSPPPDSDQYGSFSSLASPLSKKTHPLPWTSQETVSLIQTYREKWYSLNRGPLKANQWEEVAVSVAARCGFDDLSKTPTQCRHKIEKLRKRYRSERVKPYPNSWEFFDLMDHMERGPSPIAARPVAMVMHQNSNQDDSPNRYEDETDDGYGDLGFEQSNLNPSDNNGACDPSDGEGGDGDSKLAGEIRGFAEEFMRLEKKKIEMIMETERCRMEMEKRKTDMILETQMKIANSITSIFEQHHKRLKMMGI